MFVSIVVAKWLHKKNGAADARQGTIGIGIGAAIGLGAVAAIIVFGNVLAATRAADRDVQVAALLFDIFQVFVDFFFFFVFSGVIDMHCCFSNAIKPPFFYCHNYFCCCVSNRNFFGCCVVVLATRSIVIVV